MINKIKNERNWTNDPIEIWKCFEEYYKKLYQRGPENHDDIVSYLKACKLPKIPLEKLEELNIAISPTELQQAIKRAKNREDARTRWVPSNLL